MAPPPTAARLSSLCTSTLTQILELTRSTQSSLPSSPSLPLAISKNLSTLYVGIKTLEDAGGENEEVVGGLKGQYERLVGLVRGMQVRVEHEGFGTKEGKLVDTGEDDDDDGVALQTLSPSTTSTPHITLNMPNDSEDDLERMEEDEESMRKANNEVMLMQQRMLDDQDETLTSLSSAISRQHALSQSISTELTLQESLLEETDSAVDRTTNNLRRARGRLDGYSRRVKETGSTGLIVGLVVVLLVLVVVFKT